MPASNLLAIKKTNLALKKSNRCIMETQDIFIAHPQTEQEASTLKAIMKALKIKLKITKERPYNPDFVAKVLESRQQVKEGKTVEMDLSDIWKE